MKKFIKFFIGIILVIPFVVSASDFNVELKNTRSAMSSMVIPTAFYDDGSFLSTFIVPNSESTNGYDAAIAKYDRNGNLIWQKTWGGNGQDLIYDIVIVPGNGFIVTMSCSSTDITGIENKGSSDAVIVKFDDNGSVEWQKSWGGANDDSFGYMALSSDNYIYVIGSTKSSELFESKSIGSGEALLFKFDLEGNVIWMRSWGGSDVITSLPYPDSFNGIGLDENDNPVIVGYTYSTDIPDFAIQGKSDDVVLKYDKEGNLLWQKRIGGDKVERLYSHSYLEDSIIIVTQSNSSVVSGYTNKGSVDALITNIDYDGNILWQILWGGNGTDYINDIKETSDGDYIMVGYTYSTDIEGLENKGSNDAFVLKIDKDGNILWKKMFGGINSETFKNIYILPSGEYLVGGSYSSTELENMPNSGSSDLMFLIYDKDGNILLNKGIGDTKLDSLTNMLPISDNELLIQSCVSSTDYSNMTYEFFFYKGSMVYDMSINNHDNGSITVVQNGGKGIITTQPDKGYEVNQIIIKDKNGEVLDLEITKLENGNYSFGLYTDISVEVIFREKIENPKTFDFPDIMICFSFLIICLSAYYYLYSKNNVMEF